MNLVARLYFQTPRDIFRFKPEAIGQADDGDLSREIGGKHGLLGGNDLPGRDKHRALERQLPQLRNYRPFSDFQRRRISLPHYDTSS